MILPGQADTNESVVVRGMKCVGFSSNESAKAE